jgi:polar amino acid transport system substrate-binding protein
MRHRSHLVLPLLAAAALLLGACGDDDASDDTTTTEADSGSSDGAISLEGVTLVEDGQLTVCSDMPSAVRVRGGRRDQGFDYDVVSAMGDQLDVDVEFVTTPFDSIIPALKIPNCDLIASAMTITPEREEEVDFTDPYFDADQSLLVLTENEETYATLEDLAGQTIGVQVETTGATYAEENLPEGATIKEFQTGDEMFGALIADDIQAALQDLPVNAYRATTAPDQFVVTETFPTGEQYGFAVTKENTALLAALNSALAASKEDGTYDAAYTAWFGELKD